MPDAVNAVIAAARDFLGERITTNATLREHHSHGQDTQPPVLPDAVAFIETADEAARMLALCHDGHVPVVAWGAGTSLEGHVTPVRGGITLDLSRMTRIIQVSQPDMDCRVEAGVTRDQLNEHLRDQGLFFPVDPGTSLCTIGGMCATRASGTNAVRYGTIRENVLGLTVALADGRLIHTGGRVRKSATGYDLTRLFIGSEGTLGVITEIQLRLHGIPEAMSSATCQFPTLRGAVETVIAIMQMGIPVARMELLDEVQMEACIAYSKLEGFEPLPSLFFEFHGTPTAVAEQAQQAEEIAAGCEGKGFRWATDAAERARLWKARHDALWACLALKPGHRGIATDAIVPISCLDAASSRRQGGHRRLGPYRADRRPCRRRQLSYGHPGAARARRTEARLGPRQEDRGARAVTRRIVQRRARRGDRQARVPRAGARRRGAGGDALGEAGAGSTGYPQPGEDLPELTA